jgi:transglutaminase superfamily protein
VDHMPKDAGGRAFADLAAGACPSYLELMLALSSEFGAVDGEAVRDRLDDDSRALFGFGDLEPLERADRLAEVMDLELGLAADTGSGARGLLLDRVVQHRRGHPAMIAAIGAELALRAGVPAGVYASPRRWFIGVGHGEDLVVLDARLGEGSSEPPGEVRAACAHELAFCVLCGLGTAYTQAGRDGDARHAGRLRLALPIQPRS